MKQYNYSTLSAFVSRAITKEQVDQALKIIYKQQTLEPWQVEDLLGTLYYIKSQLNRYD